MLFLPTQNLHKPWTLFLSVYLPFVIWIVFFSRRTRRTFLSKNKNTTAFTSIQKKNLTTPAFMIIFCKNGCWVYGIWIAITCTPITHRFQVGPCLHCQVKLSIGLWKKGLKNVYCLDYSTSWYRTFVLELWSISGRVFPPPPLYKSSWSGFRNLISFGCGRM